MCFKKVTCTAVEEAGEKLFSRKMGEKIRDLVGSWDFFGVTQPNLNFSKITVETMKDKLRRERLKTGPSWKITAKIIAKVKGKSWWESEVCNRKGKKR